VRFWGNYLKIKVNFGFWVPELVKNCGFWSERQAKWFVSRSEWFLSHAQWCVCRPEKEGGAGKSSSCTLPCSAASSRTTYLEQPYMLGTVSEAIAVMGDEVVDMLSDVFDLRPNVFALRTIVLDKSSELVG
jgi:hypothetical protein